MATTMTQTALPAGQWTQILAAGPTSVTVQNLTPGSDLKIRIGTSVSTGDALSAAADILRPFEHRTLTIAATDSILASPVTPGVAGLAIVRA